MQTCYVLALWIPACAGMTDKAVGMTDKAVGMTGKAAGMTGKAVGRTGSPSCVVEQRISGGRCLRGGVVSWDGC